MKTANLIQNKIQIKFKGDDFTKTLEQVKSLNGRKYDPDTRSWRVHLSEENIESLKSWDFDISPDILKWLTKAKAPLQTKTINKIEGLYKKLYPFQHEGVEFLESLNGRALIGSEMGLGKTCQVIAYLQHHPELRPALIIVPASVKYTWQNEIDIWTKKNSEILSGRKNGKNIKEDFVIINYDIVSNRLKELKKLNPKVIILDECHFLKNSSAQRTKAVIKLCKRVKHIIALSGTPIVNRPIEFWNIIKILNPSLFSSRWDFANKYCNPTHNGFGWNLNGSSNTTELNKLLTNKIMIRHKKKDVLKDLPPKVRSIIPLEIDNAYEYNQVENNIIEWIHNNEGKAKAEKAKAAEVLIQMEKCKQIACKGKMKQAIKWIEDFLETGQKLVVFTTHTKTLDILENHFKEINVRLDGSTPVPKRQKIVNDFQNNENIKLFIGNIKAAGIGITLTASSNTCFLELGWSPAEHIQAEDRCVFEGQYILTKEGYKKIESIKIGDKVLTHLGKWNNVLDINSHIERKKLQINIKYFGFNEQLKVTDDHKIYVYDKQTKKYNWTKAIDIRPNKHFLVLNPGTKLPNKKLNILKLQKPFTNKFKNNWGTKQTNGRMKNIFSEVKIDNDMLFAFGYYIANGCGRYNINPSFISISGDAKKKKAVVDKVAKTISTKFGNLNTNHYENKDNCYSGTVYSKNLAFNFINWFGKGAHNKQFPDWVFKLNKTQVEILLDGYYAGDGYKRKNTQQGSTASPKLITQLILLNSLIGNSIMGIGYKEKSKVWTIEHTIISKIKGSTRIKINKDGNVLFPVSETNISIPKRGKERVYDLSVENNYSFIIGLSSIHNCHRIGQKDSVTAWYLIAKNTIEEKIMKYIEEKSKILDQVLDGATVKDVSIFNNLLQSLKKEEEK